MFEFIVRLYKYIQQNPAGVSSVPISEPSAQYLVSPPLAAVTALSLCGGGSLMEHLDALSRCTGIRPEQPQILDWVKIWASTRPLHNIQLVVFDRFLGTFCCVFGVVFCGEVQYSFFPFVLQLYFVLALLVKQNWPSRHKFFYSTLNCTQVISVLLTSTSWTSVGLQRIPTIRWLSAVQM